MANNNRLRANRFKPASPNTSSLGIWCHHFNVNRWMTVQNTCVFLAKSAFFPTASRLNLPDCGCKPWRWSGCQDRCQFLGDQHHGFTERTSGQCAGRKRLQWHSLVGHSDLYLGHWRCCDLDHERRLEADILAHCDWPALTLCLGDC